MDIVSEKVSSTPNDNVVAVNVGRGTGVVEIGIRTPDADDHPHDPEFSLYSQLGLTEARRLVNILRRAIYRASRTD